MISTLKKHLKKMYKGPISKCIQQQDINALCREVLLIISLRWTKGTFYKWEQIDFSTFSLLLGHSEDSFTIRQERQQLTSSVIAVLCCFAHHFMFLLLLIVFLAYPVQMNNEHYKNMR